MLSETSGGSHLEYLLDLVWASRLDHAHLTRAYAMRHQLGYLSKAGLCYLEMSLKGSWPPAGPLSVNDGGGAHSGRRVGCKRLKYETSLHLMTHVFCFHPPVLLRLYCHGKQAPASPPPPVSPFRHSPSKSHLQIGVILVGKWLVSSILHFLVILLQKSFIDLLGWWCKGDTSDEVLRV